MLVVPEMGMVGVPLVLSLWLVAEGSDVLEGDRVVEILAGGATLDLESPLTGRLARVLVDEDDPVTPGTPIAEFVPLPGGIDAAADSRAADGSGGGDDD